MKVVRTNLYKSLEVKGHSHMANRGHDILCASISVLTENLAMSLEVLLSTVMNIKKGDGFLWLELDKRSLSKETDLLFQSTLLGIEVLLQQFPKQIKLEVIRNGS